MGNAEAKGSMWPIFGIPVSKNQTATEFWDQAPPRLTMWTKVTLLNSFACRLFDSRLPSTRLPFGGFRSRRHSAPLMNGTSNSERRYIGMVYIISNHHMICTLIPCCENSPVHDKKPRFWKISAFVIAAKTLGIYSAVWQFCH